MAKGESIGAIAFAVVFVGILIGGSGYLYVKYKPVDPHVQAAGSPTRFRRWNHRDH